MRWPPSTPPTCCCSTSGCRSWTASRPPGASRPTRGSGRLLTTFDTDANVHEALAAGASGFLLKDAPADRLVTAIRAAATGDAVLARSVARRMADELTRRPLPWTRPGSTCSPSGSARCWP